MKRTYLITLTTFLVVNCLAQPNSKSYLASLQSQSNPYYSGFQGDFSVTDNGAAVYDIPFPVTPGVGGMTPKISFSYNSNNMTSVLGEGWSINGLSVISRANSIQAIDGLTETIKFDITDNLAIDGSRMILSNGNHGVNGAIYSTENNSFKRITIGKNSGQPINDIEYFKVETKDGLEYYYGNIDPQTLNGMEGLSNAGIAQGLVGIISTKTPRYNSVPFLWLVTLIRDKNKNWIYFKYNTDFNYYSPDKIFYGGNGEAAIGEIDFVYTKTIANRSNPYDWENRKFIRGEDILLNKPLEKIISYYLKPGSADKKQVRQFDFKYEKETFSNKLLLNKVYQSTVSYGTRITPYTDIDNPIVFDWRKTNTTQKEFVDSLIQTTSEQIKLSEDFKSTIADFNGDGFPDKLMHKNFGDKVVFYLSINDKNGKFVNLGKTDTINSSINKGAKVFTGDFNADGKNDIIYLSNDNNSLSINLYSPHLNASDEVDGFSETQKKNIALLPAIDAKKIYYGFGDFNSDGYSDLLIYYIDGNKLKYQPITFGKDTVYSNSLMESDRGDIPDDKFISQVIDINGDGITDLFFTWTNKDGWFTKSYILNNSSQLGLVSDANGVKIYNKQINYDITGYIIDTIPTQPTVQPISTQIKSGDYSMLGNIMIADLNRDGNIDVVISNTGKNGWEYYTAMGKGDGQFVFSEHPKITPNNFTLNYRSSFGDFNGDGLMDIIIQKTDGNGWFKLIAYGNGKGEFGLKNPNEKFESFLHKDFTYSQMFPTNNVLPYFLLNTYSHLFDEKLSLIDCGDKGNYECVMSSIRKLFPVETGFYPLTQLRPYENPLTDAYKDFVNTNLNFENNVKRIVGAVYTGDSTVNSIFGSYKYFTKITYGDYWQPYVADLNGDGISDLLLTYPVQIPSDTVLHIPKNELEDGLYTYTIINQSEKPGYIQEITHSNKNKTKVKYASVLLNNEPDLPRSNLQYPLVPLSSSLYTVSEVDVSNGITIDSLQKTKYIYQNGVASLNGRGFIGFEGHKVINLSNNNYSKKIFLINSALIDKGLLPVKSIQTFVNGFTNNISEDNYEYTLHKSNTNQTYNFYCTRQTSNTHDIDGFLTSRSETESSYDDYGNLLYSKTRRGESGRNEIIKEVANSYYESAGNNWEQNWLLGRLQYSTVKTSRDGNYLQRTSFFEYDSINGQLIKEVSDTGNVKFSLTKEYRLNAYGNIDTSYIYPTFDKTAIRNTITSYSKDKRFVISITDAGGYISTKVVEPVQGLLTSTSFAEQGNKNSISADEIGRFQSATAPDGTISKTERRIYNAGEFKDIATYVLLETNNISNFNLPTATFYNSAGRIVRKVNFDFKDREIITEYLYDTYGNLIKESLPYFKGERINYTEYKYDNLNRKIRTILPDSSTLSIKYFGLNDTMINAKGQKTTSQKNILGELESSLDDNGYVIRYTYDLFSHINSIITSDGRIFSMKYDINGNKIEYKNPNFKNPEKDNYNAFNQKIYSIDPNGYPKYYEYDKLDRLKIMRAERSGFKERIEYSYIEQLEAIPGKGKIKFIKSFSDDHPIDEEFTYFDNGQLKSHTYKYFSLNQRMGRGNVFTYSGNEVKDNLQYNYTYDKSQVKTVTYPYTSQTVDKKLTVQYVYTNGTLVNTIGLVDGGRSIKFWELINSNSLGLTTQYKLGDNIISNQSYDDQLFNLTSIKYSTNKRTLAGLNYSYDALGNIIFRSDINNFANYDSIFYDNLNRIIEVKTNGYSTKVDYFTNGDIRQKRYGNEHLLDFSYQMGTNKFKSIKKTDLQSGASRTETDFEYDDYGNDESTFPFLIASKGAHIEYNQYNLPFSIENTLRFYYSFDGTKDAIYDYNSHTGISYLGNLSEFNYQFNNNDGNGFLKYQKMNILVNGKVIANFYSNTGKVDFLLKDALNTVIGISDEKGLLLDSLAFDIWGLKRNSKDWKYDWRKLANEISNPKDKGFLNSISFDGYGLSDFSARLYNPITGRFISVDPITSNAVSPTQFANPYLYGYNNPTVFVDANGKFGWFVVALVVAAYAGGSAAGGSLLPWQWNDNWWKGALVGVVSVAGGYAVAGPAMFTGGMTAGTAVLSGAAAGFAGGFTATLVNGGNFAQALENGFKGGIVGGVTAGFTFGIGEAFGNPEALSESYFAKASLHGLNQGIASEAMGGSFEHGFLAGSFTSLASPMTQIPGTTSEERIIISAMVGGTASSLGGGKFANGAISGAMIQIYNENNHKTYYFYNRVQKQRFRLSDDIDFDVNPIMEANGELDDYGVTSTYRTNSANHEFYGGVDMVGNGRTAFEHVQYAQKLSQELGIFCQYESVNWIGDNKFQVDTRYYRGVPLSPPVKVNPNHPASGSHVHCDLRPR